MCTLILFAYIYLDKLFSLKLHIFTISYSKEINLNDHAWVNIKKEKKICGRHTLIDLLL